jgi:hypothetical protein
VQFLELCLSMLHTFLPLRSRISSYLTFPSPCFSSISPHGKAYKTNFYLNSNDCMYTVLYQVKTTLQCYLLHLADLPHGHCPDFLHYISGIFSPKFYAKDFGQTASLHFSKRSPFMQRCIFIRLYKIQIEKILSPNCFCDRV